MDKCFTVVASLFTCRGIHVRGIFGDIQFGVLGDLITILIHLYQQARKHTLLTTVLLHMLVLKRFSSHNRISIIVQLPRAYCAGNRTITDDKARIQVAAQDNNGRWCAHVLAYSVHSERARRVLVGDVPHPAWHCGAEQQYLTLFHLPSQKQATQLQMRIFYVYSHQSWTGYVRVRRKA